MSKTILRGCYTANITPFSEAGGPIAFDVRYDALPALLDYQFDHYPATDLEFRGVDGVVVAGCTGSAFVLSPHEQMELAGRTMDYMEKHYPDKIVIVGDGSNSTKESIELAKMMEGRAKRRLVHMAISPYGVKPSASGMRRHYEALADSIEGELLLYSVPSRTGGDGITPEVAAALADHERIIGIKEASGKMERIRRTIQLTRGKEFFVISGDDGLTLDIIKEGGTGIISVASNVAPRDMTSMVHKALRGDYDGAYAIDARLRRLYDGLFPKGGSPNPVMCHYALKKMGYPVGYPRLPLDEPTQTEMDEMDTTLVDLGIIKRAA